MRFGFCFVIFSLMKPKVLITGGAGFIGSHIADLLIKKGYPVVIVDNLSRGSKKNVNKKAKFYQVDIISPRLKRIFAQEKPEIVIHEAAQINVRDSVTDPKKDARINVSGSISLFQTAGKAKVKKIIYASSGGAIYGEPRKLPVKEDHPISPLCPYGASKCSAELYLKCFASLFGFKYVVLRYSNVFGPRQDPKGEAGVISIFIDKFLQGEAPVIFGDGKQTRDFIFVQDVALANYLALLYRESGIFNIGSGKEVSVLEIYNSLKKILNSPVKAKFGPKVEGEVRRIYLDVSLAKKKLGFKPKVNFKDGLERTINWVKSSYG